MEGAYETTAPQTTATAPVIGVGRTAGLGGVCWRIACAVALAIPTVRHLREAPPPVPPEMRLEITTPPTTDPVSLAISPDGQKIVFVATAEGRPGYRCVRSMLFRRGH